MKIFIKIILIVLLINFSFLSNAQIAINSDGTSPDASAMLDVTSTTKGILIPRMTSSERTAISSPATGLLVYDTDENSFWYYANATWINLSSAILSDTDADTKIQVEESSDEDIIRFDLGGTEFMRLDSGRIKILNTGHSVFLGNGVGTNDDYSDNNNVFVGDSAGYSNASGSHNVFTGNQAGHSNTSGVFNVFTGNQTGYSNITGSNNIFIGNQAGYSNISGNYNVFTGNQTGSSNTTGTNNAFLGHQAGIFNTTGKENTIIGSEAGFFNETGDNNVFLGYKAGYYETGSDKLYIENSNSSSPLIYGDFDMDSLQINGKLNINGAFNFPTSDGDSLQVLATDGNGALTWTDLDETLLTDADNDTKIQVEESSDEDIIRFDLNGTEYLRLDNGRLEFINTGGSIFIGEGAGENDDHSNNKNIFIGYQAGYNISGIYENIFLGYQAGYSNSSGVYNTFMGNGSGYSNTIGDYNTFYGHYSGYSNTLGEHNMFMGYGAGRQNTTGSNNTLLGSGAGYYNETGSRNTFIGTGAGQDNTTGSYNVYLGVYAGNDNITGANNIFLGYQAGSNETGSNKLYIESSNSTSPLIYGDFDVDSLQINGKLNINGAFNFPIIDGANGEVLATDGSGNLTWSSSVVVATTSVQDSDSDTKIQVEESSDEDIIRFDLGGTERLRLENGRIEPQGTGFSVFLGVEAGENDDFTNNYNTFLGFQAGKANTTGSGNIFLGANAGSDNTTGIENTFIGDVSGVNNTTGSYNTILGAFAGSQNSTGSYNVFLGNSAGSSETGSNKLYIENSNSSSPLIYGEFDNDLLQINGTLSISGNYAFPTTDGTASQILTTDGSGTLSWSDINENLGNHTATQNIALSGHWISDDGSDEGIFINADGNVGIGTNNPTQGKLVINTTASTQTLNSGTYAYLSTSGVFHSLSSLSNTNYSFYSDDRIAARSYHAISDERIKDIKGLSDNRTDLETLKQIQITDYHFKDRIKNGNALQKKVIAQQVAAVYPQAVVNNTTEIVPDIFQQATIDENGWVHLDTDLKVGEKVQIIFDNQKELLEILEVKENAFRVKQPATSNPQPACQGTTGRPATVFIYGRQVTDFHTVDYEAISMLNVSATQQLAKENEALKSEVSDLKKQLQKVNDLEHQNAEMKAMLEQIQAQLNNSN